MDSWRSSCGGDGRVAMELDGDYVDLGFDPEPEPVLVPDPNQGEKFGQQNFPRLVNTTFIFLQDIWGSRLADQQ